MCHFMAELTKLYVNLIFKGKLPMDMHSFWLTRYYALWKQRRRLLGNWEERDVSSQDANHWCKTSVEDNWPCNLEALHCCTLIPPNGTLRSMTSACKLTRVIWQIFFGNNPKYLGSIRHLIKVVTLAGKVLFLDRMVLIFVLSQVDVNSKFNLLTYETVLF